MAKTKLQKVVEIFDSARAAFNIASIAGLTSSSSSPSSSISRTAALQVGLLEVIYGTFVFLSFCSSLFCGFSEWYSENTYKRKMGIIAQPDRFFVFKRVFSASGALRFFSIVLSIIGGSFLLNSTSVKNDSKFPAEKGDFVTIGLAMIALSVFLSRVPYEETNEDEEILDYSFEILVTKRVFLNLRVDLNARSNLELSYSDLIGVIAYKVNFDINKIEESEKIKYIRLFSFEITKVVKREKQLRGNSAGTCQKLRNFFSSSFLLFQICLSSSRAHQNTQEAQDILELTESQLDEIVRNIEKSIGEYSYYSESEGEIPGVPPASTPANPYSYYSENEDADDGSGVSNAGEAINARH